MSVTTHRSPSIRHFSATLVLSFFLTLGAPASAGESSRPDCPHRIAGPAEIARAIAAIDGYDITATTNQPRFMADFLLELARDYRSREPDGTPVQIRPEDFFPAFLEVTGLEADQVPASFRLAHQVGQTFVIDYRADRLLDGGRDAERVELALAVGVAWPGGQGALAHYEYEDPDSSPSVLVRHEREISYRMFDLGDRIVIEEIDGLSGRPTSGGLGALFALLGRARIEATRIGIAPDGTQVNYTRVRKLFSFDALATVSPGGQARRGIPDERPELAEIARRLEPDPELTHAGEIPRPCFEP